MKKLILLVGLLMLGVIKIPDGSDLQMTLVGNAQAGTTEQTFGSTTYYSGDLHGTAQTYGSSTYYSINGKTGVAQTFGSTTYYSGELFNNE